MPLPVSIAVCRPLSIPLLALALVGCAARVPSPPPKIEKPAAMPWTAAIGKLDVVGEQPCTAILVSSTVILTASHCLHQAAVPSPATALHFEPNFGSEPELPAADGVILRAQGGAIQEGHLVHPEQVAADWALVGIAPAVTDVPPIPLAQLSTTEILARIASGDRLFTAGYGYGGMRSLKEHARCEIVPPKSANAVYADGMLVTTCIIRVGDSGGPLILVDPAGRPRLVGVFAGFGVKAQTGLSYAVNAGRVAPYLGSGLVSLLELVPAGHETFFP
jgi:V8-like Glu-specific endopeptidase